MPETDILDAVLSLKTDIAVATRLALTKFEAATGLTPSSIDIDMIEMTTCGDKVKRYALASVDIDLGKL